MDPRLLPMLTVVGVLFGIAAAGLTAWSVASGGWRRKEWVSWLATIAVALWTLLPPAAGSQWQRAAVLVLVVLGSAELGRMRHGRPRAAWSPVGTVAMLGLAAGVGSVSAAAAAALTLGTWFVWWRLPKDHPRLGLARQLGLVAGPGACLVALAMTPSPFGIMAWFYAVIELTDSGAWATGNLFGRTRLAPRISPNKSWEGAVGGVFCAVGGGLLFRWLLPDWSVMQCVIAAMGLGIATVSADLVASAVKRSEHVKDFSAALPGHGGVLDAFDTYLLVAPLWLATVMLA